MVNQGCARLAESERLSRVTVCTMEYHDIKPPRKYETVRFLQQKNIDHGGLGSVPQEMPTTHRGRNTTAPFRFRRRDAAAPFQYRVELPPRGFNSASKRRRVVKYPRRNAVASFRIPRRNCRSALLIPLQNVAAPFKFHLKCIREIPIPRRTARRANFNSASICRRAVLPCRAVAKPGSIPGQTVAAPGSIPR